MPSLTSGTSETRVKDCTVRAEFVLTPGLSLAHSGSKGFFFVCFYGFVKCSENLWLFVTIVFKTCDKEQEENLEQDQAHMRTLVLMDGWKRRRRTEQEANTVHQRGGVIFGARGTHSRCIATRRTLRVKYLILMLNMLSLYN